MYIAITVAYGLKGIIINSDGRCLIYLHNNNSNVRNILEIF